MKIKRVISVLIAVIILGGCNSDSAKEESKISEDNSGKTAVEMVTARENEKTGRKWELKVEKDGSFYEVLPEDDRLCADCDR